MIDPFVAALDALFASEMAVDAIYVGVDGDLAPVRVIRSKPSQSARFGTMQVALASEAIEIRRSEAARPLPGHSFIISDDVLVIPDHIDPISDVEGLSWTCWVEPQP